MMSTLLCKVFYTRDRIYPMETNYRSYQSQLALLKEAHRLAGLSKDLLQEALEREKGLP